MWFCTCVIYAGCDIILNPPCLFSDLSTGRQLSWRRVCPSKGYSYSSRLLQTSSSGLSVLLIFRSSLSLPHRCISLCFTSRDHPQLFNSLCVVILMFWPVTTDCVFTRSTVFSSVSLFMEYLIWQWFTIVVSGKIIKYRGLHCNLTNQTSSVFSVCIESNLPGVQYLEESTVVLKRLGSVRFSFFERNTFLGWNSNIFK